MNYQLRVEGIYDKRTVKRLLDNNLKIWSFDFRPTSFNFLQQYLFLDILKTFNGDHQSLFLHFQNEADFMIFDMLEKVKSAGLSNFFLEFSDHHNVQYYNQFHHPFWWVWDNEGDLADIIRSPYLEGLFLPYSLLIAIEKNGRLNEFILTLRQFLTINPRKKTIPLGLKIKWDDSISPSIFKLLPFEILSVGIGPKIEVCYRNVDLERMEKEISYLKNI